MKKTLIAKAISNICYRKSYHISDYDKATAQPFYDKLKEKEEK